MSQLKELSNRAIVLAELASNEQICAECPFSSQIIQRFETKQSVAHTNLFWWTSARPLTQQRKYVLIQILFIIYIS